MRLRPEEACAQRIVTAGTGLEVRQHDDGSADSMYDLALVDGDDVVGAMEVTADVDGQVTALWNEFVDRPDRWTEPDLRGGWSVTLRVDTRHKNPAPALVEFLRELESEQIRWLEPDGIPLGDPTHLRCLELGIASVHQHDTDYPGSIYATVALDPARSGGAVGDTADAVADWVGPFLRDPRRADVLGKLRSCGLTQRHVFLVVAGFATAPFSVSDALMRDDIELPSVPPSLPDGLTDVWVVGTWVSGRGYWWSGTAGWRTVAK